MKKIAITALALGLTACAPLPGKPLPTGTTPVAPAVADVPAPTPSDFTIGVNIIEKSCFGEYGCNLRYKIAPNYTGPTQPDTATYTVIYTVTGCDGDKTASFEMRGEKWSQGVLDWDFCTSPSGSLSASVTQILPS